MRSPSLSNRLLACCRYVNPGDRVADVGCDHGYLGIHLLLSGIATSVIASDLNEGPLQSAQRNALKYGVARKMRFYLSDGVANIPRDFDTMICAGMGADTMISILEAAPWLKNKKYHLILQCQSRRPELRKYLYENGYCILRETLAKDGKFIYPITEVIYLPSEPLTPGSYHITPALIEDKSPLLPDFYNRIVEGLQTTARGLAHSGDEKLEHYKSVLKELSELEDTINDNCR